MTSTVVLNKRVRVLIGLSWLGFQAGDLHRTSFPSTAGAKSQQAPAFPSCSASAAAAAAGEAVADTWRWWVERTARTSSSATNQPCQRPYSTGQQRYCKTVVLSGRLPPRQPRQTTHTADPQQHRPLQSTGRHHRPTNVCRSTRIFDMTYIFV